ncbi:hypothetical protein RRSWK_03553 [Rhodopirellula sp. SWK7]|nr:hypothetical protein RRSWK_03553 [Rhodopirellula sp. SWK7]
MENCRMHVIEVRVFVESQVDGLCDSHRLFESALVTQRRPCGMTLGCDNRVDTSMAVDYDCP